MPARDSPSRRPGAATRSGCSASPAPATPRLLPAASPMPIRAARQKETYTQRREARIGIGDAAAYDRHRLALGVPDGSRDLEIERSILLENGFEELNGVDFQKGCYMGQELTARTKYRALIKKRLLPVNVDGPLPAPGTKVMAGEQEMGEMRSGRDGAALAVLKLDALETKLTAGGATIIPRKPEWLKL